MGIEEERIKLEVTVYILPPEESVESIMKQIMEIASVYKVKLLEED